MGEREVIGARKLPAAPALGGELAGVWRWGMGIVCGGGIHDIVYSAELFHATVDSAV